MAQIKQPCSVTTGRQLVTLSGDQSLRIKRNSIFMVDGDLVPYTVAADATFDGQTTFVSLTGAYLGATAAAAPGVFVTDFTYPDMLPTIAQGDVGTAAVFTKAMYILQKLISEVLPAKAVELAAVNSVPKSGGSMTGPLLAPSLTSYSAGAAQPRVELGAADGEPTITMSRWTGQGIMDHVWQIKNDNGTLRFGYSGTDRTTPSYADKLILGTTGLKTLVPILAPAASGIRLPSGSSETGAGSGWMKIAKVRMGYLGTDFVIRVSGTTSYSANPGNSNGAVTTILGRIDNDNQIRGSVHTQGMGPWGNPSDVVFGPDGTIYMACGQFYQLSVHAEVHPGIWLEQPVEYYSALLDVPAGNKAVKGWSVNLNGSPTFVITPQEINTNVNYRGLNIWPATTNAYALGTGSLAYTTVYLTTGAINASDARLKCNFRDLTTAEINAARDIARAIGVYRWRDSVEAKAAEAREHIGPTVQQAIEILEKYDLNPFNYGFICHDVWEREVIEHPALPSLEAIPPTEEVPARLDEQGNVLVEMIPAKPGRPFMKGREAYTEVVREAGDRYAFRYDELAMFIAAGQEARLAALESAI